MTATPFPFTLLVDHVHDGDTIYGVLSARRDMGLGVWSTVSWGETGGLWGVRLYGINAAELSQPGGIGARDFLAGLCPKGLVLRVDSMSWDKYGRRVDGVPYLPDGTNLCQAMLDATYAVPYTA